MKYLIILAALIGCHTMNAQIADRAADRAESKATDRLDTRIDQGIDKSINAIEGLFKKKKKKSSEEDVQSKIESTTIESTPQEDRRSEAQSGTTNMFSGMLKVADYKSSYTFDVRSVVKTVTTNSKGKTQEGKMTMLLGQDAYGITEIENKGKIDKDAMVFDMQNESMIMLTVSKNGKKEGTALSYDKSKIQKMSQQFNEASPSYQADIKKTGRTKIIAGLTCHEYEISDEDYDGSMWMALGEAGAYRQMVEFFGSEEKGMVPEGYPQGMMMEAKGLDKEKGESFTWEVTDYDNNAGIKYEMADWNVKDIMGQTKY